MSLSREVLLVEVEGSPKTEALLEKNDECGPVALKIIRLKALLPVAMKGPQEVPHSTLCHLGVLLLSHSLQFVFPRGSSSLPVSGFL